MSTVKKRAKRKHNPALLRAKRAARALEIPWREVCEERDMLRTLEVEQREQTDAIHRAATTYFGGVGASPFWRGFFRRKFGRLIASGGDYARVEGFDTFVSSYFGRNRTEATNHEYVTEGWTCDDVWDVLIEERPPFRPIWEVYELAINRIVAGRLLGADLPEAGAIGAALESISTPF